jgi:hypothetical protein
LMCRLTSWKTRSRGHRWNKNNDHYWRTSINTRLYFFYVYALLLFNTQSCYARK